MEVRCLVLFVLIQTIIHVTEADIKAFCQPDVGNRTYKREETCSCINRSVSPWGLRAVYINCEDRNLTNDNFDLEYLPVNAESIDLSWNEFTNIPLLTSKSVKVLKGSNNKVQAIYDNNFSRLENLRVLDLSFNTIETVSTKAFYNLSLLQSLDLSNNKIKNLPMGNFLLLVSLKHLDMSYNNNMSLALRTGKTNFYNTLGLTPKLTTLKLEYCDFASLEVPQAASLERLYIRGNPFHEIPELHRGLRVLDISDTLIQKISVDSLPYLIQLEELYIEDCRDLKTIADFSFYRLFSLKKISLQNSRNLVEFSTKAFGLSFDENQTDISIEELNLRGTGLTTLNNSVAGAFKNLKVLNLDGMPLICDCQAQWIRALPIDSQGLCNQPGYLKGYRLSDVSPKRLDCDKWAAWQRNLFNSLLIIILLFLCGACIFLIGMGLRPSYRAFSQKIHPSSPYAPLTIEPNFAEHYY